MSGTPPQALHRPSDPPLAASLSFRAKLTHARRRHIDIACCAIKIRSVGWVGPFGLHSQLGGSIPHCCCRSHTNRIESML